MSRADRWRAATAASRAWRDGDRSYDVERLIAEAPAVITVYRAGAYRAAQTVRLDYADETPETRGGPAATLSRFGVVVLGTRNHPTLADTDLKRGDRFDYQGRVYEIVDVYSRFSDRLVARAEVYST